MDNLIASLGNVGICGYMSITYLILVFLRPEIEEIVGPRLAQLLQKVMRHSPTMQRETLDKIRTLKSNLLFREGIAIILYYGFAVLIFLKLSMWYSLCLFTIPHLVFSTNRLIRSVCTRKLLPHWLLYVIIFWLSFAVDYDAPTVYGLTCFFPMGYLFCLWIFLDHKPFFYKQQQRLSRFLLNRRNG